MTQQSGLKQVEVVGCRAKDRITGLKGVITSVAFDAVGCVQGFVQPGVKRNGEYDDGGRWFDVARLDIGARVMPLPASVTGDPVAAKGGVDKPAPR